MTIKEAKAIKSGSYVYHKTAKNKSGGTIRAKVNGQPKVWKTRPDSIRIPCKYGLYDCFQLGAGQTDKELDQHLDDWQLSEPK